MRRHVALASPKRARTAAWAQPILQAPQPQLQGRSHPRRLARSRCHRFILQEGAHEPPVHAQSHCLAPQASPPSILEAACRTSWRPSSGGGRSGRLGRSWRWRWRCRCVTLKDRAYWYVTLSCTQHGFARAVCLGNAWGAGGGRCAAWGVRGRQGRVRRRVVCWGAQVRVSGLPAGHAVHSAHVVPFSPR